MKIVELAIGIVVPVIIALVGYVSYVSLASIANVHSDLEKRLSVTPNDVYNLVESQPVCHCAEILAGKMIINTGGNE